MNAREQSIVAGYYEIYSLIYGLHGLQDMQQTPIVYTILAKSGSYV